MLVVVVVAVVVVVGVRGEKGVGGGGEKIEEESGETGGVGSGRRRRWDECEEDGGEEGCRCGCIIYCCCRYRIVLLCVGVGVYKYAVGEKEGTRRKGGREKRAKSFLLVPEWLN